jgi:pimeloyl-ACP methyl ester carboxylesterase
MEKIKSKDGTPIAYLKQGDGPPLVLVHGTGVVANNWMMVLPLLAQHFTVYAMERRGRGESGDNESYSIEHEYEDIAALVDSIGQPVNLLGHSFGGILTLEAALLTRNVRNLILYEPPLNVPDFQIMPAGLGEPTEELLANGFNEEALIFFYEHIGIPSSEIELMQALPDWEERVASANTLPREIREIEKHMFDVGKFTNFPHKTVFQIAGDDPEFWDNTLPALDQALLDFSTEILPGQGHFAMITAPDLFANTLTRFFKD